MFDGQEFSITVNSGRFFFAIHLCGVVPTQATLVSYTMTNCTQNFVVESTITLYMIEFSTVKASYLSVIREFRVVRGKGILLSFCVLLMCLSGLPNLGVCVRL